MSAAPLDELIDVLDDDFHPVGRLPRSIIHARQLWHAVIHIWVLMQDENDRPCLLLQQRAPTKTTYPDMLDISAAGHLLAGESHRDGLREFEEELGVPLAEDHAVFAGTVIDKLRLVEGIDRELAHLYFVRLAQDSEPFRLSSETTRLLLTPLADFESFAKGLKADFNAVQIYPEPYAPTLDETFSWEHLVPRQPEYYRSICHLARQLGNV